MSFTASFAFYDAANPALRAKMTLLQSPLELNRAISMELEKLWIEHLASEKAGKPNKLGAPTTDYWAKAIRSIRGEWTAQIARVITEQIGVGLHYHGGTVTPDTKPLLTIPIAALAHGRSVADFRAMGYSVFRPLRKGEHKGGERMNVLWASKGKGRPISIFALAHSATIPRDPSVIPTDDKIYDAVTKAVRSFLKRKGFAV
jgi:hypothetical protein